MRCNIHGGGMGAEAYKKMVSDIGQEFVNQMDKDRHSLVKAYDHYLLLLAEYKTK